MNNDDFNTLSCNYRNSFNKISYILLFILIIIPVLQIPIYYLSNVDWYLYYNMFIETIGQISLLCLLLFILYNAFKRNPLIITIFKNSTSLIFLLLFILWIFISVLLSSDLFIGFNGSDYRHEGFFMYIYYVAFFLISLSLKDNNKKMKLTKAYSLCSTLISIMVIYQYISPLNDRFISSNLTGVFFHFNHCGYYFAISIIATSVLLVISSTLKKRIFYSTLLILQVSALIINDTFGAYLAVLIALLLLILLFKINNNFLPNHISRKYKFLMISIPLLIFTVVTLILNILGIGSFIDNFSSLFSDIASLFNKLFNTSSSSSKKYKESTGTARLDLWKAAIKYSMNHPLLGSGLEQLTPYYKSLDFIQTKPANEYIYILASSGFPALIFYLMWIGKIFINKIKKIKTLSNVELIGVLCSISYLISAFFGNSTFYITPYFLIFLAFI